MICFDITDLDSFRNVDNWLEEIKRYCPDQTPVFIVGTKSDLESKRMVAYSTIKTYVDTKGLSYIETSSKTNENVVNCFDNFARTLVQHANQLELDLKTKQIPNPRVDLTKKVKPVTSPGCMGGNKCTI
jgi:GTPase SAR1 family protein